MGARRTYGNARDWMLSLASVCLLALAILSIDGRAGTVVTSLRGRPATALTAAGDHVSSVADAALRAANEQAMGHTSLFVFAFAGVALVVVMLRISK